jgi:hypothetical protein
MNQSSRGATSLLFAALVLPFIALGLSLVVEVSEYFNSRRIVQEILDSECRMGLTRLRGESDVKRAVAQQISSRRLDASIDSVGLHTGAGTLELMVIGKYQGRVLLSLLRDLFGSEKVDFPFNVSASMRAPKAASLVLLQSPSSDAVIRAFGERISVELKAARSVEPQLEAFDSHAAQQLARALLLDEIVNSTTEKVLSKGVELPSVTVVLRDQLYQSGFGEEILQALNGEAVRQQKRLRILMAIVGSSEPREEKRELQGEFGSEQHLLFVTEHDLNEPQFMHALARMIIGRAVIQQ